MGELEAGVGGGSLIIDTHRARGSAVDKRNRRQTYMYTAADDSPCI